MSAPSRRLAALLLVFAWLPACGGEESSPELDALRTQIEGAVRATNWNETLSLAKRYLATRGDDLGSDDIPVLFDAAQASLGLNRQTDAVDYVRQAEALGPRGDLAADLNTVAGIALLQRARELGDDKAWTEASSRLVLGMDGGELVVDATYWYVLLQEIGDRRNDDRQRTYAERFFALEPASGRAETLRRHLQKRGVLP